MPGKVTITTDALREHAKKIDGFETIIDDMNGKLTKMTNHLSSVWVDTNCQTFCTTVQELQEKQIKSFRQSLEDIKLYLNSRATSYDDAFNKIKNAHKN